MGLMLLWANDIRANLRRLSAPYWWVVVGASPFGKLSDRVPHGHLLAGGMVVLIGADELLAWSNHWAWVWAGFTFGLGMCFCLVALLLLYFVHNRPIQ
jgi:hypothetical protein